MSRRVSWSVGIVLAAAVAGAFLAGQTAGEDKVKEGTAKGERVYELRTYYCLPGRLEALHKRFKDHTMKLFEKHGMKNVVYWNLLKGEKDDDKMLIYLLAHKDKEAAAKSFDAFRKDPDWIAAKKASEEKGGGSLTEEKGGVVSEYLTPTSYSPLK